MKRILNITITPSVRFTAILSLAALSVGLTVMLASRQPVSSQAFQVGNTIHSNLGHLTLDSLDFSPEPGEIDNDTDLESFYERQELWIHILGGASPHLDKGNENFSLEIRSRTLADLPGLFWVQLLVGAGALLISGWVWSLKSKEPANRLFFLSGFSTWMFTFAAAIYTTRESALPSTLFQTLVAMNVLGATLFGISTLALFLLYPTRLIHHQKLARAQAVFFGTWAALSICKILPASLGVNLITLLEMLCICIAIGCQFFATRGDPRARAALFWLGFSVLVGAGSFIALSAVPLVFKMETAMSQGFAFLFFLLIYLGIAAGLCKYRLFDVGAWAYQFLFYAVGALGVVVIDATLLYFMRIPELPAVGIALLSITFLYLPLRDWLWKKLRRSHEMETHRILSEALDVAFAPTPLERSERWTSLLKRVFDPLEIEPAFDLIYEVTLHDDGLSLLFPSVAGVPSLKVSYRSSGRALFDRSSQDLARVFVLLIRQAESSQEAYRRGAAVERGRMAQDLHDDIGARLLTSLHLADEKLKPTLQAALAEMRELVRETSDESISLARLMADVRYEASRRLSAVDIALDWPLFDCDQGNHNMLNSRQHKAVRSALREVVTNVIRHSKATGLRVTIDSSDAGLDLLLSDDGKGFVVSSENEGHGLKNIRRRLEGIGGTFRLISHPKGSSIHLSLPYET